MNNEIIERLTRIETHTETLLTRFDKIEARTASVEKKQWMHTGALVVLAPYLAKFGIHLPT